MTSDENPAKSAEAGIRRNIDGIAEAINTQNLDLYGRLVTDDFVNMNTDVEGVVTSTVGRQARLDLLRAMFDRGPYGIEAKMNVTTVHADGNHAFAHVDGLLTLRAKAQGAAADAEVALDIYLTFVLRDGTWLGERSLGVERSRTGG